MWRIICSTRSSIYPLVHNIGEWYNQDSWKSEGHLHISTCAMEMEHYRVINNAVSAHSVVKINEVTLRQ